MTTQKMPVLFVGHGSPMNAVDKTIFGDKLVELRQKVPQPKSILVISAHWQTEGTQLVGSPHPKTIHDFYGFPDNLFNVRYAAPGDPALAKRIQKLLPESKVVTSWGLDHGAWSVLVHLFPEADVPVLQMSLDETLTMTQHLELAQKLKALREEGVLILASGNIVHNLRTLQRTRDEDNSTYEWAYKFDQNIKQALEARDVGQLTEFAQVWPEEARWAVPTPEHYLPLLYAYGASDETDHLSFPVEGFQMASISMRTAFWAA